MNAFRPSRRGVMGMAAVCIPGALLAQGKAREAVLRKMFVPPAGIARVVLDTDTYNEIDDQYAVAYALLSRKSRVPGEFRSKDRRTIWLHHQRSSYSEVSTSILCFP